MCKRTSLEQICFDFLQSQSGCTATVAYAVDRGEYLDATHKPKEVLMAWWDAEVRHTNSFGGGERKSFSVQADSEREARSKVKSEAARYFGDCKIEILDIRKR